MTGDEVFLREWALLATETGSHPPLNPRGLLAERKNGN